MKAWSEGLDYQELLHQNEKVMSYLTSEELDACFTLEYYFSQVDHIFERNGIKE